MSDPIMFQCVAGEKFSPIAFSNNGGRSARSILEALHAGLMGKPEDVEYTFAELVRAFSWCGVRNASRILTAEDSHGDGGVVLVDVAQWPYRVTCLDGYLVADGATVEVHADCCSAACEWDGDSSRCPWRGKS